MPSRGTKDAPINKTIGRRDMRINSGYNWLRGEEGTISTVWCGRYATVEVRDIGFQASRDRVQTRASSARAQKATVDKRNSEGVFGLDRDGG